MFKSTTDFGGYWVKGVKNFKGHDGESLFQCSVYKDNKKIGFFSENSTGGSQANLDCPKKEDRDALCDFAKKYEGEEAWSESYHTFIAGIVERDREAQIIIGVIAALKPCLSLPIVSEGRVQNNQREIRRK